MAAHHPMMSYPPSSSNPHGNGYFIPLNAASPPLKTKKHAKAKPQRRSKPQPPPSTGYLPVPQRPGTHYSGIPGHAGSATRILAKRRKCDLSGLLSCLSVLSFISAIILGILILLGCVSKGAGLDHLYVTKLCTNGTYDIQLRIGYFGGCVSVANTTAGRSTDPSSGASSNSSSENSVTHCVATMRTIDVDDLGEEFWEDLTLTKEAQSQLSDTLNATIPLARHLQADVFHGSPPVLHIIFFSFSGIILFALYAGSSHRRLYKLALMVAALLAAFALALAFVTAIGSLQALNALVNGNRSKGAQSIDGDVFIYRGKLLDHLQAAQVSVVAVFYTVMSIMFVRRRPK